MKTFHYILLLQGTIGFVENQCLPTTIKDQRGNDDDSEYGNIQSLLIPFFQDTIEEIRQNGSFEIEIKELLDLALMTIPEADANFKYIRVLLQIAKRFIHDGYCLKFPYVSEIIKKVQKHKTKEPESLVYNLSKIKYKTLKTVGNAIENVGDLAVAGSKTIKHLHSVQANYTNGLTQSIPYFGKFVHLVNQAFFTAFESLHLATRLGINRPGRAIVAKADRDKHELKQTKPKELAEVADKKEKFMNGTSGRSEEGVGETKERF